MKRWLCGWVRVRISGQGTERFLNLCKNKGVILWNLVLLENGMELSMYRKTHEACSVLTAKTNVTMELIGQYGMHTVLFRYRKRQAFMIFGILFLVSIWLASLHLWDIQIENNQYYTDDQIAGWLKEYGIMKGIRKETVDCELLEQLLRDSFERISWSAVTVEGTVLRVVIAENYGTLQAVYVETDPADLIAGESGIVESVVVRKGISQVKPGDTVQQGQVLISGIVPIHDDNGEVVSYDEVYADGDVMLRNQLVYEDSLSAQWDRKDYIGKEGSRLHIGINGRYWNLKSPFWLFHDIKNTVCQWIDGTIKESMSSDKKQDMGNRENCRNTKKTCTAVSLTDLVCDDFSRWYLPEQKICISWYREERLRYKISHLWRSESQAKSILQRKVDNFIKNLVKNEIVVVENQIRIYYDSVGYHADGSITVLSPQKTHRPLNRQ